MLFTSNWPTSAVVYQIYPRSFFDTNGDGIGDLKGIVKKLGYLSDLGIDSIWLSPIYKSPMFDFGYDVSNYKGIDPIFGSLSDFRSLISEAHKRGIKLIMDYIPNHTSSEHPWFSESRHAKNSPKRDWYIWAEPKSDGSPPNNWLSVFGDSAWEYEPITKQYYLHTFLKEQPDLNWRNHLVVKEMLDVLRFWLELGVDGFRVDAIYHLFKDEKLRDEPQNPSFAETHHDPYDQLIHKHTFAQPEVLGIMRQFSNTLKQYGPKLIVTEAYTSIEELIKMYKAVKDDFFSPFNFGLILLPWKANIHKEYIDEYDQKVGPLFLPNFVLGNHDRPRISSRIGEDQAKVATMLLLTLRGIPFIYYGDEVGMIDTPIPKEDIQDTFEKNMPGLNLGRDPERTPMQWNSSNHAGFSNTNPWLPINQNYRKINVEKQSLEKTSNLNLYKKLIQIRKDSKALTLGKYTSWDISQEDIFCYSRSYESETKIIILNYSNREQKVSLPFHRATLICSTYLDYKQTKVSLSNFTLRPNEGIIAEIFA